MQEQETVFRDRAVDDALLVALGDDLLDPVQLAGLERRREADALEVIELVVVEEAVLVDVTQLEEARERGDAGWFERLRGRRRGGGDDERGGVETGTAKWRGGSKLLVPGNQMIHGVGTCVRVRGCRIAVLLGEGLRFVRSRILRTR